MLKNKSKIIAILLVVVLLFSTSFVFADNEINSDEESADITSEILTEDLDSEDPEADVHEHSEEDYKKSDVYLMNDNITIDYIVDGNVFAMGDTVTINSQIGGDAFIMAKHIVVGEEGYIFSNLFAMAETIEIKGIVYDVYGMAKNLTISNGYVYRDIKAMCNTLTVNGNIGRNVYIDCENINFNTDEKSNVMIYGDLNYSSNSEISIPEGSVSGKVNYSKATIEEDKSFASIVADYIFDLGQFIVFVLIIWLICSYLAPKFLKDADSYKGSDVCKSFGYGLLSLIAVPVVCVILILLQLTAGISIVLLAAYILAVVLAKSVFTIAANNYICSKYNIDKKSTVIGTLILSGIVVWILAEIPYIGGIFSCVFCILGLGLIVRAILPKKVAKEEKTDIKETEKKSKEEK